MTAPAPALAALAGVEREAARVRDGFDAALAAAADAAWRACSARVPSARPPTLALPPAFADVLAVVIAVEERDAPPRAAALRRHYLELMPRLRVEQLATAAAPNAALFHAPLDWSRLPRLVDALDGTFALAAAAGVTTLLGAPSAAALRAACPTLASLYERTFYGACMPLLYGYPADLRCFGRALAAGDFHDVVDLHLTSPLLHELAHFDRASPCLYPLYLDECVAGFVGVRVARALAFPSPGSAAALYAAPWFAQVGQALARVAGADAIVRAHTGTARWDDVLPRGLAATLAHAGFADWLAHRQPHLLADGFRPDAWLKLIFLAAAGEDVRTLDDAAARAWADVPPGDDSPDDALILADALTAMCLHNAQDDGHFTVAAAAPRGPVWVDAHACRVSAPGGPHDPTGLAYFLPPALAARLRARGIAGYTVELDGPDAAADAAALIADAAPDRRAPRFLLRRTS
jgi:hypothetical protein